MRGITSVNDRGLNMIKQGGFCNYLRLFNMLLDLQNVMASKKS